MKYIKYLIYLYVFIGVSSVTAGSYDDFFSAIRADDGKTITNLMARGFDPNTPSPEGFSGLFMAVRLGSLKAVDALLQAKGVDVDPRTVQDETPLMIACLNGHLELAARLIELGADVNKTGWAPLHYAATKGHIAILYLLLENHAYIDAESPNGSTPLMMAASYGTPSAVKLLLESGADPLLKNQLGLTAIDFSQRAERAESSEIIAAFVRARQLKGKW